MTASSDPGVSATNTSSLTDPLAGTAAPSPGTNHSMTTRRTAPSPNPNRVTATVAATLIAASLPMFLVAALAPGIRDELSLAPSVPGLVVAAFFLVAAVASIPAGRLVDRLGALVGMRAGLIITALATSAAALATGPWTLITTIGIAGLGIALLDPSGARSLNAALPTSRHGRGFGIKEAAIPAASMLAGLVLPVLGVEVGWRPAFVGAAVLAVMVAVVVPTHIDGGHYDADAPGARAEPAAPDASHAAGRVDAAGFTLEHAVDETTDPQQELLPDTARTSSADVTRSVDAIQCLPSRAPISGARRTLVALAVTAALGGGTAAGINAYLVTAGVEIDLGAAVAGGILAGASLLAIISRLVLGVAADRGSSARAGRALFGCLVVGTLGAAVLAAGASTGSPWLFVTGAGLALGGGWGWTGLIFLAAVRLDPQRPAAASGIVLAGLAIGGVVGPALIGFGFASRGAPATFAGAAFAMAAAALVAGGAARVITTQNVMRSGPRQALRSAR